LVAAIVLWIEAACAAAAAVFWVAYFFAADASGQSFVVAPTAFAVLVAAGLGAVAVGLQKARRWATSPALTWQVLQGLFGAVMAGNGYPWFGLAMLALAIAGAAALFVLARAQSSHA
jgi:hypothetical protein